MDRLLRELLCETKPTVMQIRTSITAEAMSKLRPSSKCWAMRGAKGVDTLKHHAL